MPKLAAFGLVLISIAALALAACGGDDDDSKTTDKTEATATTSSGDNKTTSQPTTQADATKAAGDGQVTGSGADALKKLAKDLSGKTYQVTYDFTSTEAGKQPQKSSITVAQKPPKTLTSSDNFSVSGTATAFVFINDGTNSFTCFKDASGAGQCIKSKADASSNLGDVFSLKSLLNNLTDDIDVKAAGSKTIAGIDSQCFDAKGADGDGTGCFSKKDGLMTYFLQKETAGTTLEISATKVSTSVDDSLFVPPASYKIVTTG
jgi:hypothetical protein